MSFTFVRSNPQRWTDWKITDQLFDNQFAPAPEALEPMGNSIRRLLNATQGGQAGWSKLPMQQFQGAEPEQTALPLGWKGPHPDSPFWGQATPASSPAIGPQSAWTDSLPAPGPRRPTAAQADDELRRWQIQEQLRREIYFAQRQPWNMAPAVTAAGQPTSAQPIFVPRDPSKPSGWGQALYPGMPGYAEAAKQRR